jgi:hypothetical protein
MPDFDATVRKWQRTRKAKMQSYLNRVPETLCLDLIHVNLSCRYMESLLTNQRIKRYLAKHHLSELTEMQNLLAEIEGISC